jgi:hypothetical protein
MVEFDAVEDRFDLAVRWRKEAIALDQVLEPAATVLKRKLTSSAVFSVALVTMRANEQKAREFWGAVAQNDGLRKGDPAHTLVQWLLTTHLDGSHNNGSLAAALAWNTFYQGREVTFLRIAKTKSIRLLGSNVDVRGSK